MIARNTRRWERPRFTTTDRMRIFSGLFMLVIIILLMKQLADPGMWRWAGRSDELPTRTVGEPSPDDAIKAAVPAKPAESEKQAPKKPEPADTIPPPVMPADPTIGTDLDPDEQDAVQEEFQAVNDRALYMEESEKFAYARLFHWTEKQTAADLEKRAKREVRLSDFLQMPGKYRGQLFTMEVDVHRILELDRTPQLGKGKYYELWGSPAGSAPWFVVAIAPELPEGMPIGADVSAKIRLTGYFFKLQGFIPTAGFIGGKTQLAPMFIGRVVWHRRPLDTGFTASDWMWIAGGIIGLVLVGILSLGFFIWSQQKRRADFVETQARRPAPIMTSDWLDRVDQGKQSDRSDRPESEPPIDAEILPGNNPEPPHESS